MIDIKRNFIDYHLCIIHCFHKDMQKKIISNILHSYLLDSQLIAPKITADHLLTFGFLWQDSPEQYDFWLGVVKNKNFFCIKDWNE